MRRRFFGREREESDMGDRKEERKRKTFKGSTEYVAAPLAASHMVLCDEGKGFLHCLDAGTGSTCR